MDQQQKQDIHHHRQEGQSIVIIALALVGLLAFVGLAVDVGFIFARNTQLQASVDAAALAAVSELVADPNDSTPANNRATQFLSTNGFNVVVDVPAANQLGQGRSLGTNALGEIQYELSVTWPVELFFLRLVGRDAVTLTTGAVAGVFPMADIYASRRVEQGILDTSNQAIFGPHLCTSYGDPFSPLNSQWAPGFYTYNYRMLIPSDYDSQHDIIRVEIFDPDSKNDVYDSSDQYTVFHTQLYVNNGNPLSEPMNCPSNNDRRQPCLIDTGEPGTPGSTANTINPFWFVRIDENRGAGSPPGNGSCGMPNPYNAGFNTQTTYQLFYWAANPDGTIRRVTLATYTGQTGDGRDIGSNHDTDMRWVTPGGQNSIDQTTDVPTDCGSPNGGDYDASTCPTGTPIGPGNGFEVSISQDLVDILTEPSTGNRYLYLDVTAISGSSENGFELWAGPNTYVNNAPSEANFRNLYILDQGVASHSSKGVTVFGMGILPMNSNTTNRIDIPLIYVDPKFAGTSVFISMFDSDSGSSPPIHFFFDSIARSDWEVTFAPPGIHSCYPGGCNNQWVNPAYEVVVPGDTSNCDYQNPNPTDCTPFYGGRLTTNYKGGNHDTYVWQVRMTGDPYLVR